MAVPAQLARAVLVTLVVTGGFVILFGAAGAVIAAGGRLIVTLMPWLALAIGGILVVMGVAMLSGRHFTANFAAQLAGRLGDPSRVSVRGFFVFCF